MKANVPDDISIGAGLGFFDIQKYQNTPSLPPIKNKGIEVN
ncbi:hypothetical protein RINTHM_12410 [Richelia intracellularis HM01]|nr:hypothetical protein [Richelia intracellularis]CCH65701.1 hypothetical protein RINTHM_12410 [Richelia intracellularis HM01]